jgi:hypothetical protein
MLTVEVVIVGDGWRRIIREDAGEDAAKVLNY